MGVNQGFAIMTREKMIEMATAARGYYDALLADNVLFLDKTRRGRSERKRNRCDEIIAYLRAEARNELG